MEDLRKPLGDRLTNRGFFYESELETRSLLERGLIREGVHEKGVNRAFPVLDLTFLLRITLWPSTTSRTNCLSS